LKDFIYYANFSISKLFRCVYELREDTHMNSRQINCFIAVAETKNFSQASQLLYLTQSVVSYQVKMLEKELGFHLFVRDTHHVILTRAGENFYREVVKLKEFYMKAVADSRQLAAREKNSIRIGWKVFEVGALLGALLAAWQEKLPGIQLELSSQAGSDYLDDLVKALKDLVFVYEEDLHPDPRVLFVPLWKVTNYFVMNKANPLAAREHLEVEDLKGQVLFFPAFTPKTRTANEVYTAVMERFPKADARFLADFELTAMPQVIANEGMALYPVSRNSQEWGVVSRPFGHCVPMVIGIACRSGDHSKKTATVLGETKRVFDNLINV
jgi:DNA-binding transcriptional LysR family regulator